MSDLKDRILQVLGQPRLSGFATVTRSGAPWVRYVMAVADDRMTIRFASFVGSRKLAQIEGGDEVIDNNSYLFP